MRLTAILLACALLPGAALAAPQSTVLDVQKMTCALCGVTIKKALHKVPGVAEVRIDYEAKTATVTYDAARVEVAALIKATTDAGFPSAPHR